MNHQDIARLGALDVERACLRIRPLAAPHTRGIRAACIDSRSDDMVARLDPVEELLGFESIGFGETGNGQRKNEK